MEKLITDINHVNTDSKEGKMLLAALAFITTTNRTDKTPSDVIAELGELQSKMSFSNSRSMNFGQAIEALKEGKRVARAGWNGKGMYLYHVPANSYPAVTDIAKKEFGEMVPYGAYIAMKTAQNNVVPWLASQTGMLSEDWMVIADEPVRRDDESSEEYMERMKNGGFTNQ